MTVLLLFLLFGISFISEPINLDNSIISFLELFTRFSAFLLDTASILLMPDEILDSESILNNLDLKNGGFKGAPKFPTFYVFDTLIYFYNKTKNP